MKTIRTLELQLVDVKEDFTDIAVALNAMFASIDSVRKEAETDARNESNGFDTGSGVCEVLV